MRLLTTRDFSADSQLEKATDDNKPNWVDCPERYRMPGDLRLGSIDLSQDGCEAQASSEAGIDVEQRSIRSIEKELYSSIPGRPGGVDRSSRDWLRSQSPPEVLSSKGSSSYNRRFSPLCHTGSLQIGVG